LDIQHSIDRWYVHDIVESTVPKQHNLGETMKKTIKAPKGFHFMKSKTGPKLMKHTGRFKKHRGASTTLKLRVLKKHS
tara:strand:- start:228 stop:461 length:234 start_codon:yes stop_codon:yes gene_type:complete